MHRSETGLIFTATDLSAFLACPHLTLLNLRTAVGGPKPPVYDDPSLEVLRKRGEEHERAYLQQLRVNPSARVTEIVDAGAPDNEPTRARWSRLASATLDAMRDGADAIYQATLFDGTWLGRVDSPVRVDAPSDLGTWSYDVVDTKLARETKGGALLQVLLYADLLAGVQGRGPSTCTSRSAVRTRTRNHSALPTTRRASARSVVASSNSFRTRRPLTQRH